MPYSRMSPEETANLFRSGIVAVGPKRSKESKKPSREPLLTPEQDEQLLQIMIEQSREPFLTQEEDAELAELMREQSREPFLTQENDAKLVALIREQARTPSGEIATKSRSLYELIISSLTRGRGDR